MIQYSLKCSNGHTFESWFKSAASFDKLVDAGHLSCAVCGSADVQKALMAPRVSAGDEPARKKTDLSAPASDMEKAMIALREHVENNAEYVGPQFADEARSMYLGATPDRAIYGEASGAEAKALIEDGVPVAPLPFKPQRKAN